jgi:hypothetical protein
MKRDPRLQPLSRDHHHALVLARRATRGALGIAEVRRAYDAELAPHFAVEESALLPALYAAGRTDLADRMLHEHHEIQAALAREDLSSFGRLLTDHVRFEERDLFPAYEAILAAA